MSKYIIGIDLGTTNCTMSYAKLDENEPQVEQFSISQMSAPGLQEELLTLPSFLYFPLNEELQAGSAGISWDQQRQYVVGKLARERGEEVPSRLIASAKSWLSHSAVDRRNLKLPLSDEKDAPGISAIATCAHFLSHLQEAWNEKFPDAPFKEQQILITVPASFDPSAREMVQESAKLATYPEITLLEEPQAAFYSWLNKNGESWRKLLNVGETVLVVDIGGGTTDFSLMGVEDTAGELSLKRIAVGSHLLLGGDNIDLTFAHYVKNKLEEEGHALDDWQFQSLIHICRRAKEAFFSEEPPKKFDITIKGRGSRLIGGSIKTSIQRDDIFDLILNGFFPSHGPEVRAQEKMQSGIQQIGLPYARDPRITSQLSRFLAMKGEADDGGTENFQVPTAVLFNGGTMQAQSFRQRLVDVLNGWAASFGKESVKVLDESDYDFAVSKGAVCYGFARNGKAIRIKSGTSRSYFLGVEEAIPAVPGIPVPLKAICIAPFGMEEGSEKEMPEQQFSLVLGEPASFRFFSHAIPKLSNGSEPTFGTVVKNWKQELTELHPVEASLDKSSVDGKTVNVFLKSKVTELGMLELWCVTDDERKWKLEFSIRS